MLKVITMTSYRRPAYTREVLAALAKCEGVSDWLLLPNVEPGCDEVISAFQDWRVSESRLVINDHRLGLNRNTHSVLMRAYRAKADIVVHIEDDTVPSPDALQYYEWAVREVLTPDFRSKAGKPILLASGYNKPRKEPAPIAFRRSHTRPVWTPWGWAVDRARLRWLLMNWCFQNPKCFTCNFKKQHRHLKHEVYPALSRIQNIGYEMGENERTPQWYRENHRTPWVASDNEPSAGHAWVLRRG